MRKRITDGEVPVPLRFGFARWSNGQYSAPVWFYVTVLTFEVPYAIWQLWQIAINIGWLP